MRDDMEDFIFAVGGFAVGGAVLFSLAFGLIILATGTEPSTEPCICPEAAPDTVFGDTLRVETLGMNCYFWNEEDQR